MPTVRPLCVAVVLACAACPASTSTSGEGEGEGVAGEGEGNAGEGEGNTGGEGEGSVGGEGEGGAGGEGEGGGPPIVCGDGVRGVGEECDDGNNADGDGCDASCHVEPIAGQSDAQVAAFHAINALRASVDVPGAHLNAALDQSSQAHADYYANNADAYASNMSPHAEDPNFPNGFTGAQFFDREGAAGYGGFPFFEVMAFVDEPNAAVDEWYNTVLHRIPLVHPNMADFGYGGSNANGRAVDVVDFGEGASEDPSKVIVVPPPGATNVVGFFGGNEGPQPPAPPSGLFPSGPIVSAFFDANAGVTITRHDIVDASGAVLPVTFVDASNGSVGLFMQNSIAFYADGPAQSGAVFHVFLEGTVNGVAFAKDWTFTVQ